MRRTVGFFLALAPGACGAVPASGLALAQQSAQDFNTDSRFGRTELVLPRVAEAKRAEYALHHRAWGTEVHVADIEIQGMRARNDHEVKVFVRVAWYRADQQELRATMLEQIWHDQFTTWELVGEQRVDGDVGLLGETVVYAAPDAPPKPAQFPTIKLGEAPQAE